MRIHDLCADTLYLRHLIKILIALNIGVKGYHDLGRYFFQCYSFPACDLSAESVYIVSNTYLCEKDHNCGN